MSETRILVCMPKVNGYKPPIPSTTTVCRSCVTPVWISVLTMAYLRTPEGGDLRVICVECLPKEREKQLREDGCIKEGLLAPVADLMQFLKGKMS